MFFKKKKKDEDLKIEFLILKQETLILSEKNTIFGDAVVQGEVLIELDENNQKIDTLKASELIQINSKLREIVHLSEEKLKSSENEYSGAIVNATMILVELRNFLNETSIYPKNILKLAQDLENSLTFWKHKKSRISKKEFEAFVSQFDAFKTFFNETKLAYEKIKKINELNNLGEITSQEMNDYLFSYQKGEFEKILARF